MEITHCVADDLCAFAELPLRRKPELLHGVEQPAMHRLQAVAHVGKRTVHDGRKRVSEVALLERLAQIHRLDRALRIRRRNPFSHRPRLADWAAGLTGSATAEDSGQGETAGASGQAATDSGLPFGRLRSGWF